MHATYAAHCLLHTTYVVWCVCDAKLAMHTDYIDTDIGHLPDGLDGFVQALYAIGGEAPQFLHPNFPYFAQEPK